MLPRWLASILGRHAPLDAPLGAEHATDIDRSMMARALELARQAAAMDEVPVGAVVYHADTGDIIAQAHNRREVDADPAGHAELIAIKLAAKAIGDWRLNHLALAVTLEPCAMCAGAIVNARVGRVVFGARDPKAGFCASLGHLTSDPRLNHRVQPVEGVLAAESSRLLRDFFRQRRGRTHATPSPTPPSSPPAR
ncbi:MAG: nucleoside deaminase [Phycisphaerae bacterium]|jgi:tRNA(adenine34) deaminase